MIIVSDTSPICYLLLIGQIELLPRLYATVRIPEMVAAELMADGAPDVVRNWMAEAPDWLQIETVGEVADASLAALDAGERAAIALAEAIAADWLILDDREAREVARAKGLPIIGLLGILKQASLLGMVDLASAFEALRLAGFWVSPRLLEILLDED